MPKMPKITKKHNKSKTYQIINVKILKTVQNNVNNINKSLLIIIMIKISSTLTSGTYSNPRISRHRWSVGDVDYD